MKHESARYNRNGKSVAGAREGGLSSHALNLLVAALFNSHPILPRSPLEALAVFLRQFAVLDWNRFAVTLFGLVPRTEAVRVDRVGAPSVDAGDSWCIFGKV